MRRRLARSTELVLAALLLSPRASAEEASTSPFTQGELDVHADEVGVDARLRELDLKGNVRADAPPFHLSADALHLCRSSLGVVIEGDGRVKEYAGGYDDWLRQRPAEPAPEKAEPVKERAKPAAPQQRARRLTYAEQRELESLPSRIEVLESEVGELHQAMADPAFYRQDTSEIVKTNARLQSLEKDLAEAYRRWEALEAQQAQQGK